MRSFYVRAATLCLVAALALSACDSGSPDDDDDDPDPPIGDVTGTWLHEFTGEGITGRYTLTDASGVIGGHVDLYYDYPGGIIQATYPITGSHAGSQVEFDHDVLDGDADPSISYHFELTITSITQMSGTRALSTGLMLDNDAYFVRQVVLP
ncbi:MAG TPA: hypothetical protein VK610_05910 [Rhodothermales bacterium]|nr:hypothetical protein [Rhodothermales bacterium]